AYHIQDRVHENLTNNAPNSLQLCDNVCYIKNHYCEGIGKYR
ncbi:1031_t:CDS:1, partial [Acaulospora colombiana]